VYSNPKDGTVSGGGLITLFYFCLVKGALKFYVGGFVGAAKRGYEDFPVRLFRIANVLYRFVQR